MEAGDGEQARPPPAEGGDKPPKRKMKTPYQLEILESTYAVETYPSEALRGELSVKTGLSDRQLQMWFCHRRLKDRKVQSARKHRREAESLPLTPPPPVLPPQNDSLFSSPYGSSGQSRRAATRTVAAVSRIGTEMSAVGSRYYDALLPLPPTHLGHLALMERQILASVEAQLGEPLRQDGPVLGVEFDPLPPGAFGMGPRALHEYQFIPEQPSVWPEALDRVSQSHYLESSADAPNIKMTSLPSGGRYLHVNDHEGSSYTFHGQILSAGLLTQEGWQRAFPSVSVEYDNSLHGSSFPDPATDAQFAMSEVPGLESPYLSPYRRLDRKRKIIVVVMYFCHMQSDEARIDKEVEAHEKRIRKEIEKQDILRLKVLL
ncbi:hypothetical protein BHE74_00054190 [Ensete ventricosum]|nr:hypothetical protein BHE74_00054190 [Ensete ventricosum]